MAVSMRAGSLASAPSASRVQRAPRPNLRLAGRQQLVIPAPTSSSRQMAVHARSDRDNNDGEAGFTAGFIVGGIVFGTLGFLFAPQISKALLGDDQRLWLPRFLDDEQAAKDPEQTKQELIEKIAQLNSSIDEVANQLKGKDEGRTNGTGPLPKSEVEGLKIIA